MKDMIGLSYEDFEALIVCAIRYCHGRQTYMPGLIRGIVRPYLKKISNATLLVMIDDCDFQRKFNLYGNEQVDKPGWLLWKQELENERKRRNLYGCGDIKSEDSFKKSS